MNNCFDALRQFSFLSTAVKLLIAMTVGGIIGMERERKKRGAGFRTYMLVAIGASMTIILSQYLDFRLNSDWADVAALVGIRTDVSRFGAQVINGIGFLGAGTIIVTGRQEVKGLTTAAGLWASACMGLAVGAGFYECAIISMVLVLVCMRALPVIENVFTSKSRNVVIYVELDDIDSFGSIASAMKARGFKVFDTDLTKEKHGDISQVNAVFSVHMPKRQTHSEVLAALSTVDGIISIEEI